MANHTVCNSVTFEKIPTQFSFAEGANDKTRHIVSYTLRKRVNSVGFISRNVFTKNTGSVEIFENFPKVQ